MWSVLQMETGGDEEAELKMSDVPRRSSLTAADSPVLPLVVPDVIQKVIRVLREPGVALGMSVAGGIGALPDTHDEVRYHHHSFNVIVYVPLLFFLFLCSIYHIVVNEDFQKIDLFKIFIQYNTVDRTKLLALTLTLILYT